jgi:hypothetical protein
MTRDDLTKLIRTAVKSEGVYAAAYTLYMTERSVNHFELWREAEHTMERAWWKVSEGLAKWRITCLNLSDDAEGIIVDGRRYRLGSDNFAVLSYPVDATLGPKRVVAHVV